MKNNINLRLCVWFIVIYYSEVGNSCDDNQFECSNKRCIAITMRCDNTFDCGRGDISDETNCNIRALCPEGLQKCDNGNCIGQAEHCSSQVDCSGGSADSDCSSPSLSSSRTEMSKSTPYLTMLPLNVKTFGIFPTNDVVRLQTDALSPKQWPSSSFINLTDYKKAPSVQVTINTQAISAMHKHKTTSSNIYVSRQLESILPSSAFDLISTTSSTGQTPKDENKPTAWLIPTIVTLVCVLIIIIIAVVGCKYHEHFKKGIAKLQTSSNNVKMRSMD